MVSLSHIVLGKVVCKGLFLSFFFGELSRFFWTCFHRPGCLFISRDLATLLGTWSLSSFFLKKTMWCAWGSCSKSDSWYLKSLKVEIYVSVSGLLCTTLGEVYTRQLCQTQQLLLILKAWITFQSIHLIFVFLTQVICVFLYNLLNGVMFESLILSL